METRWRLSEEEELRRSTDEGQVRALRFVHPDEIAAGVILSSSDRVRPHDGSEVLISMAAAISIA